MSYIEPWTKNRPAQAPQEWDSDAAGERLILRNMSASANPAQNSASERVPEQPLTAIQVFFQVQPAAEAPEQSFSAPRSRKLKEGRLLGNECAFTSLICLNVWAHTPGLKSSRKSQAVSVLPELGSPYS